MAPLRWRVFVTEPAGHGAQTGVPSMRDFPAAHGAQLLPPLPAPLSVALPLPHKSHDAAPATALKWPAEQSTHVVFERAPTAML